MCTQSQQQLLTLFGLYSRPVIVAAISGFVKVVFTTDVYTEYDTGFAVSWFFGA
jgi:hypothetical protein